MYNPITQNINPQKVASDYKSDITRAVETIDIAFVGNVLNEVFGVESPVYLPTWWQGREVQTPPYMGVTVRNDELDYTGEPVRNGQPIWGSFYLKGNAAIPVYDSKGNLSSVSLSDFLMPIATLVTFSRQKNAVITPVFGGGSVKEIISPADWDISINGVIFNDIYRDNQQTVIEQQEMLQQFDDSLAAVEVEGKIFACRNISRLVFKSLQFTPLQGKPGMVQYSISAISDADILTLL